MVARALALIAASLLAASALGACSSDDDQADRDARPEAVVWAVGDGAVGNSKHARQVAELMADGRIDRLLYLGDVYENGTLEEFERNYESVYGRFATFTSPTPGDHEWRNHKRGYDVWWRRALGRRQPHYYSLRLAGWEIVSVNSEQPHGRGSRQYRWLRRELREPGDCRVVFTHRPRFSAGTRHGDYEDMEPVWDLLRGRARVLLGADDHDMQRLKPMDGVVQFVSGAGGRELYPVDVTDGRLAFAADDRFGALRLELGRGFVRHTFAAADGTKLDEGSLRCRELGPEPPNL
jgi:hypothetical protein